MPPTENPIAVAANNVWAASGASDDRQKASQLEHNLALALLHWHGEIDAIVRVAPLLPAPQPTAWLPPPQPQAAAFTFNEFDKLILGSHGFRRLRSNFASVDSCAMLRAAMTLAMVGGFRRGGQTTLSVVPPLVERLHAATGSDEAYATLYALLERVRAAAAEDDEAARLLHESNRRCPVCGLDPQPSAAQAPVEPEAADNGQSSKRPRPPLHLHHRGALLVRLLPPESADALAPACFALPAAQDYWDAHVDQHNVASYDVSGVLYLASQGEHFTGGSFRFHDTAGDCVVEPNAGHLLTFSSGSENPHSAGRVASGSRFALACWFTRDATQAVELPPPPPSSPLSSPEQPSALLPPASSLDPQRTPPPPPPLPLWSSDRAIASAAQCCLASNDPLHEALLVAESRGRPLAKTLHDEEPGAESHGPAAWLSRVSELQPAASGNCTDARVDDEAGEVVEAPAEGDAALQPLQQQRIAALRAAVTARESAYHQALQVRAATALPTSSSDFDVFG